MSFAADPNQTVRVFLEAQASLPEADRVTFVYRHFTSRQSIARGEMIDAATKAEGDDWLKASADLIAFGLAEWRNLRDATTGEPIPFSAAAADKVHDALTYDEVWEVIAAAPREMRLSADAKKKSSASSPTAQSPSAVTAAPPASA